MGLGKTVQAAVAIRNLFDAGAIRRVLIAAPLALTRNWKAELARWATLPGVLYEGGSRYGLLEGDAPVLIGSYDTLAGDLAGPTLRGSRFHDVGIDLLILDEAQRIKTPDTIRSHVFAKTLAGRRWAITGTPLENHPRELASILRFLYPNDFGEESHLSDLPRILQFRDAAILRRTKKQVGLELPNKTVSSVTIALSPDQAAEYAQRLRELRNTLMQQSSANTAVIHLLSGLQDLRRITVVSRNGESSKLDFLEAQIESIVEQHEKAVIFSSFANLALPLFHSRLSRFGSLLYTGGMSPVQRENVHQRFVSDPACHVMCASLKAAGVGLTWTVASHVFHTDVWWNPQVLNQADDRVHRIGQRRPVFIRRLLADGTIEQAIDQLLETKEDIFRLVIDEVAPASLAEPTLADLLSLIGLQATE
jgi:SNF2 family DNA or RNA helicase